MISVLILTKNEEQDLPGCLASVAWCDDIHVLDSLSTDGTVAIAENAGAQVTLRAFDNWSSHQNWALANVPFRYPWVLYVDADERVSPELRDALRLKAQEPGEAAAFRVRRRDYFRGRWLRHVQMTHYFLRFFRPAKMSYARLVNPISIPDGPVGDVEGVIDHYPFSKGIGQWISRHNEYSRLEAEQTLLDRRLQSPASLPQVLGERDPRRRRALQKRVFYELPGRPLLKFLYAYMVRAGFLDGRAGLEYAYLQMMYEYLIVLKTRELETRAQTLD